MLEAISSSQVPEKRVVAGFLLKAGETPDCSLNSYQHEPLRS
jgi:hypothetical protein